jgi:hypothetical protein
MQNKQDITVNKISSLRDLEANPCKGDTLLTVGEAEGATYGRDNGYILFVFHALIKFTKYFSILVLIITVNSCIRTKDKLENALLAAGENRVELEKALDRYHREPSDSLKYKAAKFLIENMPQYYYYEGELLDNYAEYYKLLYTEKHIQPEVLLDSVKKQYGTFSLHALKKKYDIQEIDSAYLCDNIEWSFKVWTEQPWNKNVPFEDFCEYILPYRLGNEKPVYWKEKLYTRYIVLYESMKDIPDIENPVKAAQILTDSLGKSYRFTTTVPPEIPRLGPEVASYLCGSCLDITDYTAYACRALGIACHIDFLPMRGDGNSNHFWISYNDRENDLHIQDFLGPIIPVRLSHLIRDFGKVKAYRYTYSRNSGKIGEIEKLTETVYPFFEQYNFKDVTVYYADCFMQTLSIPDSYLYGRKNSNIAYLCLVSRGEWIPVCWTEFNKNNLQFNDISKGTIARVATWENNKLVFQTLPFKVNSPAGDLHLFIPHAKIENATLFSKIGLEDKDEDLYRTRMIGGVFEGSNFPDFREKDTLFRIIEKPYRLQTEVHTNTGKAYQYVRYFGPENGFCNVSEVAFFENTEDSESLKGKIIGTSGTWNNSGKDYTNVFDGKTDTSFDYINSNGGWAGLDLGEAKTIEKIVYTPRNRDNYVRPGDKYELFYCGADDWVSLGVQVAESDSLFYDNVPENALLYLRNHTRGVEERIFTYEKGKQVWR